MKGQLWNVADLFFPFLGNTNDDFTKQKKYVTIPVGYLNVRTMSKDMASFVRIFFVFRGNSEAFQRIGGDCHGLNTQSIAQIKEQK